MPIDSIQSITFSKSDDCFGYDLGAPIMATIFVIGSPIVAYKNNKFDFETFIVGETIGLYLVYAMYIDYQKKLVRTYQTNKWKMKIK